METSIIITTPNNDYSESFCLSLSTWNLRILYNYDHSSNDFPSKFEKEEVERIYYVYSPEEKIEIEKKVRGNLEQELNKLPESESKKRKRIKDEINKVIKRINELNTEEEQEFGNKKLLDVIENPDFHFKPFDIIKTFKIPIAKKTNGKRDYRVHAGIYLGNKEICHAFVNFKDENGTKIREDKVEINSWDQFLTSNRISDDETGFEKMIVCHRPRINFKGSEEIIWNHITKCIKGKYFDEEIGFGKIVIGDRLGEIPNNCECLVNRCVLGLDFSELADCKGNKTERFFDDVEREIEEMGKKLDNLINHEKVNDYSLQAEVEIKC